MRAHPDGGNNGRCLNKFSGHANARARGHQGSSTFNADGSRSVRRSPALDQFSWRRAKPRFMTPNAKSVSDRFWQMSHYVRPNPAHVSHTLVSQFSMLQEVVRHCHGYKAWQRSQPVRSNTLTPHLSSFNSEQKNAGSVKIVVISGISGLWAEIEI
jgi:hypothetical protein